MTKGGIRQSIFTMVSSVLGAGTLSLPMVISNYGILLGLFLMLCFAIITYKAWQILDELIQLSGKNTYANLCAYYLGKKNAKFITKFLIFS
jgi:amino acid permease